MNPPARNKYAAALETLTNRSSFKVGEAGDYAVAGDLLEWRAGERSDEELTAVVEHLRTTLHETAPTLLPWGAAEYALAAAIGLIERLAALGKE